MSPGRTPSRAPRRIVVGLVAPLVAAACALGALAAPALALDRGELRSVLGAELRQAGPANGAFVRDLDTGETLFSARPDRRRIPASVTKLFVTSSALLRFGPDGALETRVLARSEPGADGVLEGDLVLTGAADPTLTVAALRTLGRRVAQAGVERVDGGVVVDDRVGVLPPSAAADLVRGLRSEGVRLGRRARSGPPPLSEEDGEAPVVLAAVRSPTLRALATRTNVPSDNLLAEQLLRSLGVLRGAATAFSGVKVVRATLGPLGVVPRLFDGSGLSRGNRTSPREVVQLLEQMEQLPDGRALRGTLAVTGRSGTVAFRMRRSAAAGRCSVKTGTLRDVSALVGICRTRGGGDVAFAWLMNRAYVFGARTVQDRMTAALARYTG